MALSLKERLLKEKERKLMRKEQKRAELLDIKNMNSGEKLVNEISKGKMINKKSFRDMKLAVEIFSEGGERQELILSKLGKRDRVLYSIAKEEMKGEWMESFALMAKKIIESNMSPERMSWPEWRQFGIDAGMNEDQIVDALKVIVVFKNR